VPPINEVAYAAYARQHGAGHSDRGAAALLATIRLVMLVWLPAYAGLAVVAPVLVPVLLGEKWLEIVPLLPVLCGAMAMLTLQILFAPATNARGHPGIALRVTMLGAGVMPVAFLIGSHWGIIGFAWGWVGGMAVLTAATILLSRGVLGLALAGLLRAILPPFAAALVMAAGVALALEAMPPVMPLAKLAAAVLLGVALYLAALWLIAPERLAEALRFLREQGEARPVPAE
jgi:O-antigen/teichoic acid export membrane protein